MLEVTAAILSSVLFNVSLALQSVDAGKAAPSMSFRPSLLGHLVSQPVWLLGSACGLAAVGLETYALRSLPLAFVQPVVAAGVLVLPFAAWLLSGETLSLRWLLAVAVILSGIAVLTLAAPTDGPMPAPPAGLLLAATGLAVLVLIGLRGLDNPAILLAVAGAAYGSTSIWVKTIALSGHWFLALAALLALAGFGAVGFLAEMSVLQRLPATMAAPPILALTTIIPVMAGHLLLGERWTHPELVTAGLLLTLLPGMWLAAHVSLGPALPPVRTAP